MLACFRGNREEFYGEVLLLDEKKMVLTAEQGIKKSSKASAVLRLVFSHLNLRQVDYFGLRFCDNKQQTHWLDPSKTLSQHQFLMGPPYIFYFGVKFYAEDPSKLDDETTRSQFYLQLHQDVRRGRLPLPASLRAHLSALMLQVERGDHTDGNTSESEEKQEARLIYKTLRGVSRPQAQRLFLSLCSSLQMYGVSLFVAYGENHTEYFLGPTPAGVVIYKNKVLVGKYFWHRITKLHFKDKTFELRVCNKNGSETSFLFQTSDHCDCKRLWKCCVEHHAFFRMSRSNILTQRKKPNSAARSPSLSLSRLDAANQAEGIAGQPVMKQLAPPAVQRSIGRSEGVAESRPSAPWETSDIVSGLFNPKFPPSTKEEGSIGEPHRRSQSLNVDRPIRTSLDGDHSKSLSLDGDRLIRPRRRRCRSHGNTSSESERTLDHSERRRRRMKFRGRPSDKNPDSASHSRTRSLSPNIWRHVQKQLVEPEGLIDRHTEEIPYQEVRTSGEPIRVRRSSTGRRHQRRASASEIHLKMVPPLSVTMTTDTSFQSPTSP